MSGQLAQPVARRGGDEPPASPVLRAPQRLRGTLAVPSDKSVSHRALILLALAEGSATVTLRQPGQDVLSTVSALRSLGTDIERQPASEGEVVRLQITGLGEPRSVGALGSGDADCGNSGTTMRLLAGALASGAGQARLTGDASLSRRPMERVAQPLRVMGADVRTTDGRPPLIVEGRRPLRALEHVLPVASAQLLAAIALAGLAADGSTIIRVPGRTRDHSERMLAFLGARVRREEAAGGSSVTFVDGPAGLQARALDVPGDFSSAGAWVVAASLHRDAEIQLRAVGLNPTRTALLDVLRAMGADISLRAQSEAEAGGEPVGDIVVRTATALRAVSIGPELVPALVDELPLLAVAMAAADGTSEVRGAAELRVKESDRISTMAAALSAAGARVDELPDGWRIRGGPPRDARITTQGDHRIAIAMAVAAWTGVAASVVLDDPGCVGISYRSFWRDAATLGAVA